MFSHEFLRQLGATVLLCSAALAAQPADARPLALADPNPPSAPIFREVLRDDPSVHEPDGSVAIPAHLRRTIVNYATRESPGTVVVDTANTYLYYVLGGGKAVRYGIGVGREGFTWSGVKSIERKAEWPDWVPPAEMIARQPYLPRWMAGGPGNPLGARALYLGGSLYRIHGTNQPSTIGHQVSSGCIRMLNEDVTDLYSRVGIGTKVVVLNGPSRRAPEPDMARSRSAPLAAASSQDWSGLYRVR
jgi:lipoprotein-anchoring transpeptidase ErfK/SrfK